MRIACSPCLCTNNLCGLDKPCFITNQPFLIHKKMLCLFYKKYLTFSWWTDVFFLHPIHLVIQIFVGEKNVGGKSRVTGNRLQPI